jgi:tyrosyl-tRNA synthetase
MIRLGPVMWPIKVDKLLVKIGLADSVTDAARKRKAGGVYIGGQRRTELFYDVLGAADADLPLELLIQVGKRSKKVVLARK